jgi:hypothetical protein
MGERIAHEVDAAAPPGRLQRLGDRGLQSFMRVGDNELWRDNLSEKSATIRMRRSGRGFGMIVAERQ